MNNRILNKFEQMNNLFIFSFSSILAYIVLYFICKSKE